MRKLFFLFVFVCLSTALFADMTVVEKVHTGPMMGKPAQDSMMTMRIKGNQARIEHSPDTWLLVDLGANMVYTINPAKKSIASVSLNGAAQTGDVFSMMAQNMKSTLEAKPGTEVINGYKCQQYHLTTTGGVINLEGTFWITKDVDTKEYAPFRKYGEGILKTLKLDDLNKLEGMVIRSNLKINMMGQDITSNSEVQSISHEAIPAATFALPKDYTMQELKMPPMATQTAKHQ